MTKEKDVEKEYGQWRCAMSVVDSAKEEDRCQILRRDSKGILQCNISQAAMW